MNSVTPSSAPSKQSAMQGLRRCVGRAIADFNMIEDGDRIMVCVSGGKDSYTLLDVLLELQRSAPIQFSLVAVNLDQKQPGFPEHVLPEYLAELGVAYHVIEEDTYSTVKRVVEEGKTTCALCSRLRRGILYSFAKRHGIHKIALGHHADDMLETLMLNMFHAGTIKSMPPKLVSDDGVNTVIRPLAYAREADIETYSQLADHPIIPCNLCGSQPNLQRQNVKAMLQDWETRFPGRIQSMLASMGRIAPSQLLDTELHDFSANGATPEAMESAFDPFAMPTSVPAVQVLNLGEPQGD